MENVIPLIPGEEFVLIWHDAVEVIQPKVSDSVHVVRVTKVIYHPIGYLTIWAGHLCFLPASGEMF